MPRAATAAAAASLAVGLGLLALIVTFVATQSRLRRLQQDALRILRDFQAAVAALPPAQQLVWWAESGTALGAERAGAIIPWDDDVDVSIMRKDAPVLLGAPLGAALAARGLKVIRHADPPEDGWYKVVRDKGGSAFMDVFLLQPRADDPTAATYADAHWRAQAPDLRVPLDATTGRPTLAAAPLPFGFVEDAATGEERRLTVPALRAADNAAALEALYGPLWRRPRRDAAHDPAANLHALAAQWIGVLAIVAGVGMAVGGACRLLWLLPSAPMQTQT